MEKINKHNTGAALTEEGDGSKYIIVVIGTGSLNPTSPSVASAEILRSIPTTTRLRTHQTTHTRARAYTHTLVNAQVQETLCRRLNGDNDHEDDHEEYYYYTRNNIHLYI